MATHDPLTMERLEELLDVHGTDEARWPPVEWQDAARLVASSAEARRLWDEAAALDALLARTPVTPPSPALVMRVLADAPRPRPRAVWPRVAAAALPLAAAAAVVLWLRATPAPTPPTVALTSLTVGEYTSPTDYLLDSYGVDVADTVPAVGCTDSTLGCPKLDGGAGDARSDAASRTRVRA